MFAAAARRYGPGGNYWQNQYKVEHPKAPPLPIHVWQLWNETDISYYFWRIPSVTKLRGSALQISHTALTAVNPGAKIALGGLPSRAQYSCSRFLDDLYAQPGLRHDFDIVRGPPVRAVDALHARR